MRELRSVFVLANVLCSEWVAFWAGWVLKMDMGMRLEGEGAGAGGTSAESAKPALNWGRPMRTAANPRQRAT